MSKSEWKRLTASNEKIQLYPRRWWLINCIGLENIIYAASLSYFGASNNIFADYFEVSYTVVDWFNVINKPADWIVSACLALLTVSNKNGFRKISIISAVCSLAGCMCNTIAFAWPRFYFLLFLGNFLIGILGGILLVVPISFIILWFPDNEIGSALSIRVATANLGMAAALLVPCHILFPLPCQPILNTTLNTIQNDTVSYAKCKNSWMTHTKTNMMVYQGSICILALVSMIILIIFAADKPPLPPTIAQAQLRQTAIKSKKNTFAETIKLFFSEVKCLFTDLTFIILVILFFFVNTAIMFQNLFTSEIMRPVFKAFFVTSNPDVISSYLIVLFQVGGIVGAVFSGQLTNKIKSYVFLLQTGFWLSMLCSIALTFSYYFKNIPLIFVTNFLLGLCINFVFGPLYEISTQHTYPKKPDFVMSCLTCGFVMMNLLLLQLFRIMLNTFGAFSLLTIYAACFAIGLVLTHVFNPQYQRLHRELNELTDDKNCTESQPLLKQ